MRATVMLLVSLGLSFDTVISKRTCFVARTVIIQLQCSVRALLTAEAALFATLTPMA